MTTSSPEPGVGRPSIKQNESADTQENTNSPADTSAALSPHVEAFGTTNNPCPDWCEWASGHGYDNERADAAYEFRYHERTFPAAEGVGKVSLTLAERRYPDGHLDFVELSVNGPESCDGLTSAQARALADALRVAADAWDEVSR